MTNQEILNVALRQSAEDLSCAPEDFLKNENVVVISKENINARRYLTLPFSCQLASYGSNIVASVAPELKEIVSDYINRYEFYHCFETPNMLALQQKLLPHGLDICFMAEYFLPDMESLKECSCPFALRVMTPDDFASLYLPEWSNALCEKRKHLDMLAVNTCCGEARSGKHFAFANTLQKNVNRIRKGFRIAQFHDDVLHGLGVNRKEKIGFLALQRIHDENRGGDNGFEFMGFAFGIGGHGFVHLCNDGFQRCEIGSQLTCGNIVAKRI